MNVHYGNSRRLVIKLTLRAASLQDFLAIATTENDVYDDIRALICLDNNGEESIIWRIITRGYDYFPRAKHSKGIYTP